MPTIISHAIVPIALGLGLGKNFISTRLLWAGALASILPDFDVVTFRMGIDYAHEFGHRGASHSLVFALGLAILAIIFCRQLRASPLAAFVFILVATASHGLLDMFTNGGLGVSLFWPFHEARLFFPTQVIEVSPLSVRRFFSLRGMSVILSELIWVWLPCFVVSISLYFWRRKRSLDEA
ncbi:MAG: metal-dependent hydrolase [Burkholderiales bacterium]